MQVESMSINQQITYMSNDISQAELSKVQHHLSDFEIFFFTKYNYMALVFSDYLKTMPRSPPEYNLSVIHRIMCHRQLPALSKYQ